MNEEAQTGESAYVAGTTELCHKRNGGIICRQCAWLSDVGSRACFRLLEALQLASLHVPGDPCFPGMTGV